LKEAEYDGEKAVVKFRK